MSAYRGNGAIRTWSGGYFFPLDPRPEHFTIEDIAKGLSNACRYGGQCDFYSVAQHSVLAAKLAPKKFKLQALLHDSSEGLGLWDLPKPVKYDPQFKFYRRVEERIMRVVAKKFGFSWPKSKVVGEIDTDLLTIERKLFSGREPKRGERLLDIQIFPVSPRVAEKMFLEAYQEITGEKVKSTATFSAIEYGEHYGKSRSWAGYKLRELQHEGRVEKVRVVKDGIGTINWKLVQEVRGGKGDLENVEGFSRNGRSGRNRRNDGAGRGNGNRTSSPKRILGRGSLSVHTASRK